MRLSIAFITLVTVLSSVTVHAQNLPNFKDIVEAQAPAVVKIDTTTRNTQANQYNFLPDQQNIPEIFRHFLDPRSMPDRQSQSMGSGFLVSEDGYLLTNNHVVSGADEIIVRLQDRREFEAELIGTDERSDLALLKIEAKKLPYLKFADPEDVQVGEWVLAIGAPFGLDFSASAGIVSAIGRSIPTENNENYVPFIQTDVAINPGNSGGPLFNLDGEVIGINSQIYTRSGGSIGLSFAIPANVAIDVVKQLKDKGRVDRGWLGVMIQEVDKDLAQSFGLRKPGGALVARIESGSPADKSDLEVGDIIVEFNGQRIAQSSDLPHVVGSTEPGSKVPVEVMREGKEKTLSVTVATLESRGGAIAASNGGKSATDGGRLGMAVESLDKDVKEELGVDAGVLVVSISPDGPADDAGLQAGDVITQIGFNAVNSVADYDKVVQQLPKDSLLPIRFVRQGQPIFRTIATPK
ncbi:DegQ family serine endoprotease [Halioxenophilus aromaticivorans]|uniref:Probable periplasmic serine endoprotease DegP-like n=1 Tax=Halioxenophilus aromaticivorans TaxID=1306992 RepID=A0AAV3TWJ9_9ALTE